MPGLTADDPVYLKIKEIVHSAEGQKAALAATAEGRPALSGVDPLLQAALGPQYQQYDQGPSSAGFEIAKMMRALGYKKHKSKPCGVGCVAKTGQTWVSV